MLCFPAVYKIALHIRLQGQNKNKNKNLGIGKKTFKK